MCGLVSRSGLTVSSEGSHGCREPPGARTAVLSCRPALKEPRGVGKTGLFLPGDPWRPLVLGLS